MLDAARERLLKAENVEALQLERERTEKRDDEQQPFELGKRPNGPVEDEPVGPEKAEGVRQIEGDRQQQSIEELQKLEVEFLAATEHG